MKFNLSSHGLAFLTVLSGGCLKLGKGGGAGVGKVVTEAQAEAEAKGQAIVLQCFVMRVGSVRKGQRLNKGDDGDWECEKRGVGEGGACGAIRDGRDGRGEGR